jgi:photosystem II stability/assembly factor-like uncharacterized protein
MVDISQVLAVLKSLNLKIFNNLMPKIGILILCILVIIPGLAPVSLEESSAWTKTNGPSGGIITTIEIDADNPDILYAGGAGGGVYKTTNGGKTWVMPQKFCHPSDEIRDIILLPDNTLFALTHVLHKSTDKGETWHTFDDIGGIACMDVNETGDTVVVGTWEGFIYKSVDGGEHFENISQGLPHEYIADIALDTNGIWAGTANGENGQLYYTEGDTWHSVHLEKPPETDINTIWVDPETNAVYTGLVNVHNEGPDSKEAYMFKTTDSGKTWEPMYITGLDAMVNVMGRAVYDDTMYVGSGDHVYKSVNGKTWEWIGPPGRNGDMYDIAVDPRDTNVIYCPRRAHGISKSVDSGKTWAPVNTGLYNVTISLIAPHGPAGTVYATSVDGAGIFKTTDYGETWMRINEGINHPWGDELQGVPNTVESVWFVADVAKVFITDNGRNWNEVISPDQYGFRFGSVYALEAAPSDPGIIYGLKNGFGIFKTDNGENWRFLHQSEVDYTYTLAVHPFNPDIVYSGYSPKPFQDWAMVRKSLDGGETWETVLQIPDSTGITSVKIDPGNPDTVYAGVCGTPGRVYKTTNGGETWDILNKRFIMCTVWGQPQLVVDFNDPLTAYTGTWLAGTWKTTNGGKNWTLLENAPVSSTALAIDRENPHVLYSADRTSPKVWMSTDSGKTWDIIGDFTQDGAFLMNRVFVKNGSVYAATFGPGLHGGRLYTSGNNGQTWEDITHGLPRSVLDIDISKDGTIYVTTHIFGCYKSVNNGETWEEVSGFPNIGGYDIEVDPVEPNILYAAGMGGCTVPDWCMPHGYTFTDSSGVYKSTDHGETWTQVLTTANECRAVRLHPDDHTMVFAAAMDDGLLLSEDSGKTWSSCNAGLNTTVLTSCAVCGDSVYVGTQACGVYSGDIEYDSNNIPQTVVWDPARSNKPVPEVYSLEIGIDPVNNYIFVGSNPGGLYRSGDNGITFYDKNFLTPSVIVDDPFRQGYYTFGINPENPQEVWLGTWGKGIFKSYDSMDFDITANGTNNEMVSKHITQIVVTNDAVYIAAEEGVFVTYDDGITWETMNNGLETLQVRTLIMTSDNQLICGTLGYELYMYNFRNRTWEQMPPFSNFGVLWPIWDDRPLYQYTTILFHPDGKTVYAGTFPAGVYKSEDTGKTWREINVGWTNDGVFSLVFHPDNTDIIYAGTYNGINLTTDAGAHWELSDTGWPPEQWVFSIDFDPETPDIMYACSKNGENEGRGRDGFRGTVMKSVNGGKTWSSITTGLDINQEFYKIIVDPHDSNIVYLATQVSGVFISYNAGETWEPWNTGLTNVVAGTNGNNVTNTMVLSEDGFLYFGTAGSGVFRRPIITYTGPEPVITPESGKTSPEPDHGTIPVPQEGINFTWIIIGVLIAGIGIIVIGYILLIRK